MKTLLAAVFAFAALGLAGTAPAKADDTPKLLGKWEVTKSASDTPVGTVIEFAKDGKLLVTINNEGKDLKLDGTYKLTGKKIALKLSLNEQKIEQDLTVTFKGEDGLELEDADKKVDTLKKKK
ncbi:TIGR03066 family protein [Gemmata sp. JC673]|uniref:TIGR03066 family protein n=1 Tax=Gemmata algarum TaxID=2975278 RepID=A0ABU5ESE7_9BACT|nr:TIGR03066 family protein [Gemmata algarum]MDY3558277.1 TIGR03066 family protein [Gemmata algarum]